MCTSVSWFRQDTYPACFIRRGKLSRINLKARWLAYFGFRHSLKGSSRMNGHHYYGTLIWSSLAKLTPRLVTAVIILVVGYVLAVWISRAVQRMLMRSERIDPTVKPIIVSTVHYVIMILVVVIALDDLGVQTASLIAILGAAGLAIGLALQGTLANIAAGIMLLWLRPFHVGDYIEAPTNNISGTVKEIGLFACLLRKRRGRIRLRSQWFGVEHCVAKLQ